MAKGNLFLGTAAKSVGDVVMYRREGSQVSRVRVRKIANPKTDAQCEQRAFMSAVVKFYQPLANVLDRSWQGLSRSKSYSKFLKTNAAIVRAGGYYLPKGTGFFPLPLKLSNGTIKTAVYNLSNGQVEFDLGSDNNPAYTMTTIGTLSSAFVFAGYQNGDVITILASNPPRGGVYRVDAWQFIIDTTSDVTIESALNGLRFDDVADNDGLLKFATLGATKAAAIIVSRFEDNAWKRSTQEFVVDPTVIETTTSDAAKTAAIESYRGTATDGNPLVYLDGDELQ